MPSPKKRKAQPRKKEYIEQDSLRDALFKTVSGMVGPQIGRILTPPDSNTALVQHELEGIKLYLFDIVKRLDSIERRLPAPTQLEFLPGIAVTPDDWKKPFDRDALYRGPNKNKGQDFVRKNIAQILKNMIPQHYMDSLPPEVRAAYNNILGVMAPPNDPIWEKEPKPDPREPLKQGEPWGFKDIADYWNNIAEGTKKIDDMGANLVDEAIKGANEALIDDDNAFGLERTKKEKEHWKPPTSPDDPKAWKVDLKEKKEEKDKNDKSSSS